LRLSGVLSVEVNDGEVRTRTAKSVKVGRSTGVVVN
jgi:hypothetical protein